MAALVSTLHGFSPVPQVVLLTDIESNTRPLRSENHKYTIHMNHNDKMYILHTYKAMAHQNARLRVVPDFEIIIIFKYLKLQFCYL